MKRRLGLHLLAAADLDDLLGRDHDLADLVLEPVLRTASLMASATFFSKFDRTLTEYQRIAIMLATSVSGGSPARCPSTAPPVRADRKR
jgi:hypothetical protein